VDAIRIGLLGCGTVGGGTVRTLVDRADDLAARVGVPLQLRRVAVRDTTRDRGLPAGVEVNDDALAVVLADDVDVVVELIGGLEPAGALVAAALAAGKPVITANKALVADRGAALHAAAEAAGVDLFYEAAVAGAIPIVRPLRASLAGDRVTRVVGILNGTTNYILTRMSREGAAFADVLADAQALGYAEADPTADVDGHDAAAKAAILAGIAFDTDVPDAAVFREGISGVTAADIAVASRLGYVVKLLGIAQVVDEEVAVRVHPTFLPRHHPLASVDDAVNAVYVEAEAAGELVFQGPGAGAMPTASAVVGDLVEAARNLVRGTAGASVSRHRARPVRDIERLRTQYYVRLDVDDAPGVLAGIARTFGDHEVSIAQVLQEDESGHVQLVLVTHRALEQALRATVAALASTPGVRSVQSVLRVESEVTG
jgi:homoserine dehydrogenase